MDSNEEKKDLAKKEESLEVKPVQEVPEKEVQIAVKEETSKEEKKENQEIAEIEGKKKKLTSKKKKILIIIAIAVLVVLAIFSTIFAILNIGNDKIVSGISIKGIEVSGLTKEEALQKIQEAVGIELGKDVLIKKEDYENTVSPEQIEAKYDIEGAVDEAYSVGRLQNIFSNNYSILRVLVFKRDI